MLRSSGILGTIVIAALGVQAAAEPTAFSKAIRQADRVAASVTATWTKFDPKSDAYAEALDAVKRSGALNKSITMSVTDFSITTDKKTGVVLLEGVCLERRQGLGRYRSRDEHKYMKDYDTHTRKIQTDYDLEMRTLSANGVPPKGPQPAREQAGSGTNESEKVAARIARRQREHVFAMTERRQHREILFGDLDMIAESRRKRLGPLRIHATITPELAATLRPKKLAFLKSVGLTLEVQSFELQPGNKEIHRPVSIASLKGQAVAVSLDRHNATQRKRSKFPKRVAP